MGALAGCAAAFLCEEATAPVAAVLVLWLLPQAAKMTSRGMILPNQSMCHLKGLLMCCIDLLLRKSDVGLIFIYKCKVDYDSFCRMLDYVASRDCYRDDDKCGGIVPVIICRYR
jgi:hypothetical protein